MGYVFNAHEWVSVLYKIRVLCKSKCFCKKSLNILKPKWLDIL